MAARLAQHRGLSPSPGGAHDYTTPSAALVPVTPVPMLEPAEQTAVHAIGH
jgi:hypothetical protein